MRCKAADGRDRFIWLGEETYAYLPDMVEVLEELIKKILEKEQNNERPL